MKWGIKTKSTPFGKEEPFVKPFGTPNKEKHEEENHSHWKTSSPMASPHNGESLSQMKGGSKK